VEARRDVEIDVVMGQSRQTVVRTES